MVADTVMGWVISTRWSVAPAFLGALPSTRAWRLAASSAGVSRQNPDLSLVRSAWTSWSAMASGTAYNPADTNLARSLDVGDVRHE